MGRPSWGATRSGAHQDSTKLRYPVKIGHPKRKFIFRPLGGIFVKMLDLQGSPPYLKAQFRSRGSLRRAHRFYLMMASSAALWCHWECILNIRVCQQKKFNWIVWYQLVSFHFWYHLITSTSHSIPKAWLTCSMGFLPFDQKTWEMVWTVFNQVSRHHAMSSCPKNRQQHLLWCTPIQLIYTFIAS